MTYNQSKVDLTLERIDICDLLLACTCAGIISGEDDSEKWDRLHRKLVDILVDYDKNHLDLLKQCLD